LRYLRDEGTGAATTIVARARIAATCDGAARRAGRCRCCGRCGRCTTELVRELLKLQRVLAPELLLTACECVDLADRQFHLKHGADDALARIPVELEARIAALARLQREFRIEGVALDDADGPYRIAVAKIIDA